MPNEFDADQLKQNDLEWNARLERSLADLSLARQTLLSLQYRDGQDVQDVQYHPQEVQALQAALADGVKPSDYVRGKLSWLFHGLISPEQEDVVLDAVDRLTELPYDTDFDRRSFRCSSAKAYITRIRSLLRAFCTDATLAYSLQTLLEGRVPLVEWGVGPALRTGATLPFRIAAALDARDAHTETLVRDVLLGDGAQNAIRQVIRGVLFSRREDLYQLVGKLLVAARLQEGLRQAICETADDGQLAGLCHIIDVIAENDLIRFSGVKRAVGCWLGLMTMETRDLERISGKSLELVQRCLTDRAFLAECLKSEDAMAIYIALWAMGVQDVTAAAQMVLRLAKDGSHHQQLVACVFLSNLNMPELQQRVCIAVCLDHPEEMDLQAICLRQMDRFARDAMHFQQDTPSFLQASPELARRFCEHLLTLRKTVKKTLTFSPCVFPWNEETLTKSAIALNALYAAHNAGDAALLDACVPLLSECDTYVRASALCRCYASPHTPVQREMVLRSVCDKSEDTRREALKIVRGWSLTEADYAIIVELLRCKYADVRPSLTDMLMRQQDDALFATVQTLLGDKSEERRMAGLGIVKELTEDNPRPDLVKRCTALVSGMEDASDKAQMVLKGIDREQEKLYSPEDVYVPHLDVTPALMDAAACFQRYFPDGSLAAEMNGSVMQKLKTLLPRKTVLEETEEDITSLVELFQANLLTPVPERDGMLLNSLDWVKFRQGELPLRSLWESWLHDRLADDPVRLVRLWVRLSSQRSSCFQDILKRAFGPGWGADVTDLPAFRKADISYASGMVIGLVCHLQHLIHTLMASIVPKQDLLHLRLALLGWIALRVDAADLHRIDQNGWRRLDSLMEQGGISALVQEDPRAEGELLRLENAARWIITLNGQKFLPQLMKQQTGRVYVDSYADRWSCQSPDMLLRAVCEGVLPVRSFYAWLMEVAHPNAARTLLGIADFCRAGGRETANHRRWNSSLSAQKRSVESFLGHEYSESPEDQALLARIDEIAQPLLRAIVDAEVHRSDAGTPYSPYVPSVSRLEGAETFTLLLSALGKDKIVRHDTWSHVGRAQSISFLLGTCVPLSSDTPESLRALIKARKLTQPRMIEAALYCPEWLPLLEAALGIPGLTCAAYYFIAHMKENSDQVRQAYIARYTPLTGEELAAGAFDIAWFRRACTEVGEAVMDQLYVAAKYISSGGRHARARKYADAVLGRITLEELAAHIGDKRNQDALMAYPLVPLRDDADLRARYLFIQDFLKGSKKFGAQRIASEKAAGATALTNLAANAGYADAMRLTLRMEASLIDELRPLMAQTAVGEVEAALVIGEDGRADIRIEKAGKALKSIPAKIKKDPHILALTEAKKQLLEQHRRTRLMLETAMEDETVFTVGELAALMASEVLAPLLKAVVFLHGEECGLFDGRRLETADGRLLPLTDQDELLIAHPYHLYVQKQWLPWQQRLFADRTVQPFRQVFRELYVLTQDEAKADVSQRYAGHQIQPGKAFACLKGRRWVADPECGLQRVDYRRNIVSVMLAQGDWFTPADIEAPTLDAVIFCDRITGRRLSLCDVPPVYFSEIMRDMDLAVSVAHAGGVDPEASHSTIEMRTALLELTLPLFRLENVEVRDRHAIITGKLARYTVHLGSGIVHQVGGTMLNILPVHSAHRGRIFLPFADNDPQTAEVLSKVLLLAEDGKLKDPTILEQISRIG